MMRVDVCFVSISFPLGALRDGDSFAKEEMSEIGFDSLVGIDS